MNYKRKQNEAKLETWYVCHKLGLKLSEWKDVRSGRRNLTTEKLDLFNELTYKNTNEWINQEDEKRKIDEWYETQTQQSLKSIIKEFNINQKVVSIDIGCEGSSICRVISNPQIEGSDIKYLLYYYLTDEFNRRDSNKTSKSNKNVINRKEKEKEEEIQLPKEPTISNVQNENLLNFLDNEKEEVWYREYQKMANKYHDTKEELDRYKFLIDEIRKRENIIEFLSNLDIKEKVNV